MVDIFDQQRFDKIGVEPECAVKIGEALSERGPTFYAITQSDRPYLYQQISYLPANRCGLFHAPLIVDMDRREHCVVYYDV